MLNIDRVARLQKQPPPLWVLGRVSSARRGNVENRGSRRVVEGAEGRQGRVIDRGWKGWRYDAPSDVIARYNPLELPAGALSFSSSLRARPVCCLALIHLILLSSSSSPLFTCTLAFSLSAGLCPPIHPATLCAATPSSLCSALLCFASLCFDSHCFSYALLNALRRRVLRRVAPSPPPLVFSSRRLYQIFYPWPPGYHLAVIPKSESNISAEYMGHLETSRVCLRGNHTAAVHPQGSINLHYKLFQLRATVLSSILITFR